MTKYLLTDANGQKYCPMSGHSQHGCPGSPSPEHSLLFRMGYGWSIVPGPTDAELLEETRADRELMLDEFHGKNVDE